MAHKTRSTTTTRHHGTLTNMVKHTVTIGSRTNSQ